MCVSCFIAVHTYIHLTICTFGLSGSPRSILPFYSSKVGDNKIKWFCIHFYLFLLDIPSCRFVDMFVEVLYASLVLRHTRSVSLLSALDRMLICSLPRPLNVWPELLECFQFWQVWTQMVSFALLEFQVKKNKTTTLLLNASS